MFKAEPGLRPETSTKGPCGIICNSSDLQGGVTLTNVATSGVAADSKTAETRYIFTAVSLQASAEVYDALRPERIAAARTLCIDAIFVL